MHTDTIESYLNERIERLEADLRYWQKVARSRPAPRTHETHDGGSWGLMTWTPANNEVVAYRHADFCKPGHYCVYLSRDPLYSWRDDANAFEAVVDDFGNLVKVN